MRCLWVHRIGAGRVVYDQPVLPDGCIDLVTVGDGVAVAGPATRTTTVRLTPGTLSVGVRFRPGAAPALVGVGAAELRDRNVPVGELWGRAGAGLAARVVDAADDAAARLGALVDGLVGRLAEAKALDPVGVGVADLLAEGPADLLPLPSLAEEVGLSERQLRRRVEDAVGYPPRMLTRILRFQRFLRAARAAGPGRHLARLAAEAGYADQAHLTRESRQLAGLPPAALLNWEAERLGSTGVAGGCC